MSSDPGNQYSVSLMNSLVLYVGTQVISFIHNKGNTPSTSTIAHTAHMDIFQHLVVDLDTEGRIHYFGRCLSPDFVWDLFQPL